MMVGRLKKQWFIVALVAVFAAVLLDGTLTLARAGIFVKSHGGASVLIFCIFLSSGLIIEINQITSGIRDVRATLAALIVIVGIAPLVAVGLARDFLDTGVVLGLFLVAAMPTTLSSGVVMTGQAGGNIAHALFVTILSNCVAILSIPVVLPLMLGPLAVDTPLAIDQEAIFVKLVLLVLLPLCIGLLVKRLGLTIATPLKKRLGMLNQCIILTIVFMSLAGARSVLIQRGDAVLAIVPLVTVFHGALLAAAVVLCRLLNIGTGRREAVLFMGAQKTLPLAVMLQLTFFPTYGTALLVCVLHHIIHLMIDGYIAARMHP
jgi:solute carrier family 10 (sodium/bile acid cotransporter), member 7